MKILLPLVVVLMHFYIVSGQNNAKTYYVWAEKGAVLRTHPTLEAEKQLTIPFGTPLTLLDTYPSGDSLTIKYILNYSYTGRWWHVSFHEKTGYIFDGFLSRLPAPLQHKTHDTLDVFDNYFLVQLGTTGSKYNLRKYDDCALAPSTNCVCGYTQKIKRGIEYNVTNCAEVYTEVSVVLPNATLHEGFLLWQCLLGLEDMSEFVLIQKKDSITVRLKESGAGCDYQITKTPTGVQLTYGCGC